MKRHRRVLLLLAFIPMAAALATYAKSRVRDNSRRLELLSSLPPRDCLLIDCSGQRILRTPDPQRNSDLLVWRQLLGLAPLPEIEGAILVGNSSALPTLAQFGDLKKLTLFSIRIDQSVITELNALEHLSSLQLINCKVGDEEIRMIRARLPGCIVQTDSDPRREPSKPVVDGTSWDWPVD